MAVLQIRKIGDPVLRSQTKKVENISNRTRELIDNMVDTMYSANGVGLAAPQVGVLQKIITVDVDDELFVLINPEIVSAEGEALMEEACLSIPGKSGSVIRSEKVVVKGLGRDGQEYQVEADGFLARAFQHEIDHLNGKLFIDKIVKIGPE